MSAPDFIIQDGELIFIERRPDHRPGRYLPAVCKRRKWREHEDVMLRLIYANTPDKKIQAFLCRTIPAIKGRANYLGLHKDPEFTREYGRWQKGHVPWNKGIKFTAGGRSANTRFKPGNLPHNTLKDGDITIRRDHGTGKKYKYIRLAKGKWELFHRYIWKQFYGDIPPGMILRFRNGDTLDTRLQNLEMISRRENAQRNRNPEKYSKTMRRLWQIERTRALYGLKRQTKLHIAL